VLTATLLASVSVTVAQYPAPQSLEMVSTADTPFVVIAEDAVSVRSSERCSEDTHAPSTPASARTVHPRRYRLI
jgi:hypothetical protein